MDDLWVPPFEDTSLFMFNRRTVWSIEYLICLRVLNNFAPLTSSGRENSLVGRSSGLTATPTSWTWGEIGSGRIQSSSFSQCSVMSCFKVCSAVLLMDPKMFINIINSNYSSSICMGLSSASVSSYPQYHTGKCPLHLCWCGRWWLGCAELW